MSAFNLFFFFQVRDCWRERGGRSTFLPRLVSELSSGTINLHLDYHISSTSTLIVTYKFDIILRHTHNSISGFYQFLLAVFFSVIYAPYFRHLHMYVFTLKIDIIVLHSLDIIICSVVFILINCLIVFFNTLGKQQTI